MSRLHRTHDVVRYGTKLGSITKKPASNGTQNDYHAYDVNGIWIGVSKNLAHAEKFVRAAFGSQVKPTGRPREKPAKTCITHYYTPNRNGTLRRSDLRRLIDKGLIEAKCTGKYTDDYRADAADNFAITDWMPAILSDKHALRDGCLMFTDHDFTMSTGHAYWSDTLKVVVFRVMATETYHLRLRGQVNNA